MLRLQPCTYKEETPQIWGWHILVINCVIFFYSPFSKASAYLPCLPLCFLPHLQWISQDRWPFFLVECFWHWRNATSESRKALCLEIFKRWRKNKNSSLKMFTLEVTEPWLLTWQKPRGDVTNPVSGSSEADAGIWIPLRGLVPVPLPTSTAGNDWILGCSASC